MESSKTSPFVLIAYLRCHLSIILSDAYSMESPGEFAHALTDCIRRRGAMQVLSSDNAQCEVSNGVKEVLQALVVDNWQNEACNPNQQFFEQ